MMTLRVWCLAVLLVVLMLVAPAEGGKFQEFKQKNYKVRAIQGNLLAVTERCSASPISRHLQGFQGQDDIKGSSFLLLPTRAHIFAT
jgi:hypothetical protein